MLNHWRGLALVGIQFFRRPGFLKNIQKLFSQKKTFYHEAKRQCKYIISVSIFP